jgi:hypothetical protein
MPLMRPGVTPSQAPRPSSAMLDHRDTTWVAPNTRHNETQPSIFGSISTTGVLQKISIKYLLRGYRWQTGSHENLLFWASIFKTGCRSRWLSSFSAYCFSGLGTHIAIKPRLALRLARISGRTACPEKGAGPDLAGPTPIRHHEAALRGNLPISSTSKM